MALPFPNGRQSRGYEHGVSIREPCLAVVVTRYPHCCRVGVAGVDSSATGRASRLALEDHPMSVLGYPRRVIRDVLSWLRNDEGFWHRHFTQSQQLSWFIRWCRRLFRLTPSDPRCKLCHAPFGSIGGKLFYLMGRGRSRKNPHFCTGCFEHAPL